MSKNNRALDNKCPACHASIKFNPKLNLWKCEYCDSEFSLEELKKYNNASSEETNKDASDDTEYDSYRCKNCGAEIIADSETTATFCVYCGNTAIIKNRLSGKFAPDYIIPFKITKNQPVEQFKKLSKGHPLMPKGFNSPENIEKIRGIYIPFWLFDISIQGELKVHSLDVDTWCSGDYEYTKRDNYDSVRAGKIKFQKIPVDGSTRFADDIMNTIEPFNYADIQEYNHAFLSGFLAEKYDVSVEDSYKIAVKRSMESTHKAFLQDIKHQSKTIYADTLVPEKDNAYYALLPVWMVNVKYKDKEYLFAMNGQTGEFVGNIPLDKGKTLLWTVGLFLGLSCIILIVLYLSYIVG